MQDCNQEPGPTVDPDTLPVGEQPCCEASDEPACDEPEVVECVCDRDAYCCETEWDSTCVGEAIEFCDARCA
ncbi:hypothetical protein [Nannocystis exedens]|uniref:hypothetical protein n=1 Tax=Nannocystis exedens TaxID=54 RepID=UPI000BBA07FF|nr:hypothetical protein [Nannocystis exedens]